MRVTNQSMAKSLANNIQNSLENLQNLQNQVSSGKKIKTLSDDPIAATRALSLRNSLRDIEHYNDNIEDAKLWLNLNESLLADARTLITTAKTNAQQATNSTTDADSRTNMATQIDSLRTELLSIANTKEKGRYVFSGFSTNTPAFSSDGVYQGDNGSISRIVGPGGLAVTVNFSGQAAFQGTEDAFQVLEDLSTALKNDDTAAISAQVAKLSALQDQFLQKRTETGTRLNALTRAKSQLDAAEDYYSESLSNAENVDSVKAAMDLTTAKNVYEASLSVAAGAVQKTLLDFLS